MLVQFNWLPYLASRLNLQVELSISNEISSFLIVTDRQQEQVGERRLVSVSANANQTNQLTHQRIPFRPSKTNQPKPVASAQPAATRRENEAPAKMTTMTTITTTSREAAALEAAARAARRIGGRANLGIRCGEHSLCPQCYAAHLALPPSPPPRLKLNNWQRRPRTLRHQPVHQRIIRWPRELWPQLRPPPTWPPQPPTRKPPSGCSQWRGLGVD